jgi:type 1 glutamine amidotransferase
MRSLLAACCALFALTAPAAEVKPLRVLLVSGGCCHDYTAQKDVLAKGLEARAHVRVDVIEQGGRTTNTQIELYKSPDWAKGYDVVLHDECFANVKDLDFIRGILRPHQEGTPAVNLHCAMHCYRSGTDDWFSFVGLQSTGHGPQKPIDITFVDNGHPITETLSDWTTINEELYNQKKLFDTAHPLAKGKQKPDDDVVVAWTNLYGPKKTRVFGTTIGHNTATLGDPRYLEMVTRGLLWSCDKLNDQYLKPAP